MLRVVQSPVFLVSIQAVINCVALNDELVMTILSNSDYKRKLTP